MPSEAKYNKEVTGIAEAALEDLHAVVEAAEAWGRREDDFQKGWR